MEQVSERRRESGRAKVLITVWVREIAQEKGPIVVGKTRDMSQGGLRFAGNCRFSENSFLDLLIETSCGLVRAKGRVAHVNEKPGPDGTVETGVSFFDFDTYAQEAISSIISQHIH
jgi:hypothetical protein